MVINIAFSLMHTWKLIISAYERGELAIGREPLIDTIISDIPNKQQHPIREKLRKTEYTAK